MNAIVWNADVLSDEKATWENGTMTRKDIPPCNAAWYRCSENGEAHYFVATCPCGCGTLMRVPVHAGVDGWKWDGNETSPTLTPSIQMLTPCRWHGYLTNGIFNRC